jgi:hypothetical protein
MEYVALPYVMFENVELAITELGTYADKYDDITGLAPADDMPMRSINTKGT